SPSGRTIGEKDFAKTRITDSITIEVHKFEVTVLEEPETAPSTTRKTQGRVIERNGKALPSSLQVLLMGHGKDDLKKNLPALILVARADSSGYFGGEVPTSKFDLVVAIVSGIPGESPVRLEDSLLPKNIPVVVELPDPPLGPTPKDCECSTTTVPSTPTQSTIADSPGMFSTDLGTGCVRFNVPNRAIEEFNFYSVVRTSEPDIVGMTAGTIHDTAVAVGAVPPPPPSSVVPPPPPLGAVSVTTIENAIRTALVLLRPPLAGALPSWEALEASIRVAVMNAGGQPLPANFFSQFDGWGQAPTPWGFGGFGSLDILTGGNAKLDQVIGTAAAAGAGVGAPAGAGTAPVRLLKTGGMTETPTTYADNPRFQKLIADRVPAYRGSLMLNLDPFVQRGVQRPPGRVPLDRNAPVDW